MKERILVAGIGNVFLGDDAFGVETVQQLLRETGLPPEVRVRDFGIRSYDLAYEIAAGYEAVILVDAVPRGEEPGTIFLIEPDASELGELPPVAVNAHALSPMRALQMARSLNQELGRIYLVGCEPAVLMTDDGLMGLSKPVAAAVPQALKLIREIVVEALNQVPPKRALVAAMNAQIQQATISGQSVLAKK